MAEDLSDVYKQLRDLRDEVRRLRAPIDLENSAIENGRMRFIGGLLRVDSGGRVEIVGTLHVEGTTDFVGPVTISGQLNVTGPTTVTGEFTLDGPWTINGDGDITGDVDVTGDFEVLGGGRIKVGDVVLTPGNGGRITIGTGSSQIIIDPSQLKVGPAFKIDPAHSSTGAQLEFGTAGQSTLYGDAQGLQLSTFGGDGAVRIGGAGAGMPLGTVGVRLDGDINAPDIGTLPPGEGYELVVRSKVTGLLRTFTGGTGGGPGDGIFAWPFPLGQVTSEYGPRTFPYTGFHEGIDFGIGPSNTVGTPIPSMGSGTVVTSTFGSGWGNYVVVDHGSDPLYGGANIRTLYAHMVSPGVPVGTQVTLGQTVGQIGNTGNSFGPHLHLEIHVNGSHTNPRTFMAAHGG